jgi:2',3'-cyclic-nucleotide 2'-phosphodiesterase (5'-nucleotidase family)
LDGERGRIRYEETNLGNFITDIMVEHTGAAVGLLNAGAIRSSIKKGPVTVEDVFKAMPYENELVLMDLTGGEIKTALERAVRGSREEEDGGFLHVSGIFVDVKDHRIDAIRMKDNKTPLDPNGVYRVVLPDFLASGGDGHGVFQNRPFQKTGLPLRELIVDTITERKKISGGEEGRIRRLK